MKFFKRRTLRGLNMRWRLLTREARATRFTRPVMQPVAMPFGYRESPRSTDVSKLVFGADELH